jgi:hypothetical protein
VQKVLARIVPSGIERKEACHLQLARNLMFSQLTKYHLVHLALFHVLLLDEFQLGYVSKIRVNRP